MRSNEEAKKLDTATETKTVVGEQTTETNKILEHAWWLKKNGRSDSTINSRVKLLKLMVKRGVNLYDPETVKEVIAKQTWSNGRKNNASDAYSGFLRMVGGKWERTTLQESTQTPLHTQRNRNRPTHRWMQSKSRNFSSNAQRNWCKTWRNLDTQMG